MELCLRLLNLQVVIHVDFIIISIHRHVLVSTSRFAIADVCISSSNS
jgi:hypothetical protein